MSPNTPIRLLTRWRVSEHRRTRHRFRGRRGPLKLGRTRLAAAALGRRWLWCLTLCLHFAVGCSSFGDRADPRSYPFTLEVSRRFPNPVHAIDLDRDGEDELVYHYVPTRITPTRMEAVVLMTNTGEVIDQLNYDGAVQTPLFRDVDGDERLELLVPVLRDDSLFVSVASSEGKKLFSFFLIDGKPRLEPEGVLPWDPYVNEFYVTDLDSDGRQELVTIINTRYARLPRGVLIHGLPGGETLGRKIVGAAMGHSILEDIDGDGVPELVVATLATNNGAEAGGFDDGQAYIIRFDLAPVPSVAWSQELGESWQHARFAHADFDGDGHRELMVMSSSWGSSEPARLEVMSAGTGRTYREFSLAERLSSPVVIDLDRDTRSELALIRVPGEVWVLDGDLDVIKRRRVAEELVRLEVWPDVDGDGVDEIAAYITGARRFLLLDPALRVKASHPGTLAGVLRHGLGQRPSILVNEDAKYLEGGTVALELARNPFFWLYRYGPPVLMSLGIIAFLSVALAFRKVVRRSRLLQSIHAFELEGARDGLLVVDSHGGIRWMNRTVRNWMGIGSGSSKMPRKVKSLADRLPGVAAFCNERVLDDPPKRSVTRDILRLDDQPRPVRLIADPLLAGIRGDPHWLVRVTGDAEPDADDAIIWSKMSQRIIHSIKSPLTSILLSVQRLRMEYVERAPAVANRLDRYSVRIEERIEELRRLTSSFLKFANLEERELVDVDPNDLVAEFADSLRRSMPPDIRLNVRLKSDLPLVSIDRDQIVLALDNLVVNAINAMPDGGVISLSTDDADGVRPAPDLDQRDYVKVEVLDTGTGIPNELRDRVFEAGFSTREDGTGLGLSMVRKIVLDHGGAVTLESEVDTGSAVTLYLPVRQVTG